MSTRIQTILPLFLALIVLGARPSTSPATTVTPTTVLSLQDEQAAAGDSSADEVRYASRELRVRVWHDKDDDAVFARGEALQLYFRTNDDAYVVIYYIDADGYTEILWPQSRYDDGFVFGGHTYSIPGRSSDQGLWVSQSRGVEYVEAIASQYPFDLRQLAIDFRFGADETGEYAHRVSGDPFLAVNDINYAITGLDEDVDWLVTDWTHIYVDQKVEYPRYTCTQCHTGNDPKYAPYTSTCTQVNIYADWGWYTRWYASFGYYPLYCDAPYYYWDRWLYRPYYYSYYPIYYSWPSWNCYVRSYPVYRWRNHPRYRGDYVTLYERGTVKQRPIYDISRSREPSPVRGRDVTRVPPSIARRGATDSKHPSRVSRDQLTRNEMPVRAPGDRKLVPATSRTGTERSGVRPTRGRPDRTVRSLNPNGTTRLSPTVREGGTTRESGAAGTSHGRRWTRPVVRNAPATRNAPANRVSPAPRQNAPQRQGNDRSVRRPSTPQQGERQRVSPPPARRSQPSKREAAPKVKSRDSRQRSGDRDSKGAPHASSYRAPRSGGSRSQGAQARRAPSQSSSRQGYSAAPRRPSQGASGRRVAPAPRTPSAPRPSAPARSGGSSSSSHSRGRGGRG